jgi:hypothetical protein
MRKSRVLVWSSLLLAAPLLLAGCGSDSKSLPDVSKAEVAFVGPERCAACHDSAHNEWKNSWHTKKATYGPAFEPDGQGAKAGKSNINPWVRDNWGSLLSHMILDQATAAQAAAIDGVNTGDLFLTKKKFAVDDVAIVVGATRKQRYAVYYDGNPVTEAYVAYTTNGGIRYDIKKDGNGDPIVVSYPGNKARAGYNFLFIEIGLTGAAPAASGNNYSEFRSWQERCIGCHTTGFDVTAWNEAKADYIAGSRTDLKDIFVTDIRISCESCHGAGAKHAESRMAADIINPAKLSKDDPTRQLVCGQCHTRAQGNTVHAGANDNRGFILGETAYTDVMQYTRPGWGKGNRQVSIDGKGRRDHQQDMDMLLTKYINEELGRGTSHNPHGNEACFDCHNSHGVGSKVQMGNAGQSHLLVKNDPDGTIRLKGNRQQVCGSCHAGQVNDYLKVLDGTDGWSQTYGHSWNGTASWGGERGRGDRKQHIFSTDGEGRSFGLHPAEYVWTLKPGADLTKEDSYIAIWPWERDLYPSQSIYYGAQPWIERRTDPNPPVVAKTDFAAQFAGPGACTTCHKSAHNEWKKSWHTLKATYGPGFEGQNAGTANINPWVRANWDNLLSHMIVDQANAALIAANPGVVATGDLILTKDKFALEDVAIVVGATRKQRYAVYYDGGAVPEAYVAYTTNNGIRYDIKKDVNGNPYVISYPGNKARAGYNFLFIEVGLTGNTPAASSNNYGEYRSWQERCIGCHTTGFDFAAWNTAKADFVAGNRDDLKDIFVADIRVSCEACHGAGADHVASPQKANIINPANLAGVERQAVCGQCHTRTTNNLLHAVSHDNRGFSLRDYVNGNGKSLMEVFEYTRPVWGDGNRQVSIDGKGRRDHQQDMDIMLTDYIRGGNSFHGSLACFDCHNSHGVGSNVALGAAAQPHLKTASDIDGLIRLSEPREQMCGSCHGGATGKVLGLLNGQTGWDFGSNSNKGSGWYGQLWNEAAVWNTAAGRGDSKQHIFNSQQYFDSVTGTWKVRSYGLAPAQYVWSTTNTLSTTKTDYRAIWPWERTLEQGKGRTIVYGATPWVQ